MKKFALLLGALIATLPCLRDALAQSWPARTVTVVSPYPPGGTNDLVARLYAERLGAALGAPFIVENRPGAAGMLGSLSVAKAAPDGYTLLSGNNGTHVIQPLVSATVRYDPVKDFTPIALFVEAPQFLGVSGTLPVHTVAELIAMAKREPGKMNYGSAGSGSFGNFSGEMLKLLAGIDVVHVPFRGSGAALTDLIAGRVQFMLDPVVVGQAKSGKVRLIATTNPQRFPTMPEVPTMKESGLPEFALVGWFALFGPANLPREIVARLSGAIAASANDPELQNKLLVGGVIPSTKGPEALDSQLKSDLKIYADIKRRANIEVVE